MSQKKSRSFNVNSPVARKTSNESSAERSVSNQNIRGVRFMREGKFEEAIPILRSLVMPAGCTWTRPDAPNLFKRNYATVLLLAGHPSGCLELLAEMRDEQHPRVQQLRAAIKRWEKTLSIFQWLNWRTGWIEPENRPVTLDFIPGELEGEALRAEAVDSAATGSHLGNAVAAKSGVESPKPPEVPARPTNIAI